MPTTRLLTEKEKAFISENHDKMTTYAMSQKLKLQFGMVKRYMDANSLEPYRNHVGRLPKQKELDRINPQYFNVSDYDYWKSGAFEEEIN